MATIEKEGEVPHTVAHTNTECKTWYKVFGDLSNGKTPVIVLHGGPGACHEYMLPVNELTKKFGIPTIFYDQIGNGKGAHFREKDGDDSFWNEQLFVDELDNLVKQLGLNKTGFDILGQSWGGMFGSSYAATQPEGLRRLIINSSPASVPEWEAATVALVKRLPKKVRDTLEKLEREGKIDSKEYQDATVVFNSKHMCNVQPFPCPALQPGFKHLEEDPTSYKTMKGFALLKISGNLKTWSNKDRVHTISVPVLLVNGVDDQASDATMLPYFQRIKKVKWAVIDGASHTPHLETPEKFIEVTSQFLLAEDV